VTISAANLAKFIDKFDPGLVPVRLTRLGSSKNWGYTRWFYSVTNLLPAFIYFAAYVFLIVRFRQKKKEQLHLENNNIQVLDSCCFCLLFKVTTHKCFHLKKLFPTSGLREARSKYASQNDLPFS